MDDPTGNPRLALSGSRVSGKAHERAFTLIELLVVIAIIAILAAALMPVLNKAEIRARQVHCMNNLRQLMIAWRMYADDNAGSFPPSPDYNSYPRWVAGDMRGGTVTPGGPGWPTYAGIDATNEQLLVELHYSVLGPYVNNPAIYKCPADLSTWGTAGTGANEQPRVRSYSMSQAVGPLENGLTVSGSHVLGHWLSTGNQAAPGGFPWKVFIRDGSIQGISPSDLWVLLEEHPNSINDAAFAVEMPTSPLATYWVDVPTKAHENACEFAFADCHAEVHEWLDSGSIPQMFWAADESAEIGGTATSAPKDADILWVAHRTTCLAVGAPSSTYQP